MTNVDPDDVLDGWGARLAAARNAAGMTQRALSVELDVALATIQRWEAARRLPSSRRPNELDQRRLSALLDVRVSALFPRTADEAALAETVAELEESLARVGNGCS